MALIRHFLKDGLNSLIECDIVIAWIIAKEEVPGPLLFRFRSPFTQGSLRASPGALWRMESMGITASIDMRQATKGLDMSAEGAKKVVKRTVGDMRSRAPGWVSKAVREDYTLSPKDIKGALHVDNGGTMKIRGVPVDSLTLIYKGRALTYTHYKMRVGKRGPYPISVEVRKGKRKELKGKSSYDGKPFVASSGREGTAKIPFQREGKSRLPIQALKTLSVPQTIESNDGLKGSVKKVIEEGIEKRFEHYCEQYLSK